MIRLLSILCFLLVSLSAYAQPDTQTHRVQSGETKYGISRQYGISIETLEKYNPDIKSGLKTDMVLLIPTQDENKPTYANELKEPGKDKIIHRVKSGETLYSLSKKYGVSLDEAEKLNPELKESGLKEGMVLLFPRQLPSTNSKKDSNYYWHKVEGKETAWHISRTYSISLDSLYLLNPEAEYGIREGQMLKLPKNRAPKMVSPPSDGLASDNRRPAEEIKEGDRLADTADGYILYPVKPGDTFYNLKQRFLTSREELVALNPELSAGLQVDRYILIPIKQEKLPGNFFDKIFNNTEIVGPDSDPSPDHIQARDSMNMKSGDPKPITIDTDTLYVDPEKMYRVAVLLPFYAGSDTSRYENGINPRSEVAVDFYNAFLLAADTLSKQGMNLELKVFDTGNNSARLGRIISELNLYQPDLVIGPLFKSNVERVARGLKDQNTLVVSPLSSTVETSGYRNIIKCIPGSTARVKAMAKTINRYYPNFNLVFLDHPEPNGMGQTREISELIAHLRPLGEMQKISRFQVHSIDGDLKLDSILDLALVDSTSNLVVSLSEEKVFLSTLVGELRSGSNRDSTSIQLMVPSKVMDINTLDYNYLNDLKVTMATNSHVNYSDSVTLDFVLKFREAYGEEPSKYAFYGYDIGDFFLQKLWKAGPWFETSIQSEARMMGTGFLFLPSSSGGYENQYMMLTRVEGFELIELEAKESDLKDSDL